MRSEYVKIVRLVDGFPFLRRHDAPERNDVAVLRTELTEGYVTSLDSGIVGYGRRILDAGAGWTCPMINDRPQQNRAARTVHSRKTEPWSTRWPMAIPTCEQTQVA